MESTMILVIGHLKIAPEKIAAARPHIRTVLEATRKEAGCLLYAFAHDALEPGTIRISERWANWETLQAHGGQPHMEAWRAVLKDIGVLEREVIAYEAGETRAL
jgi:quinol monooxygenase YgiN